MYDQTLVATAVAAALGSVGLWTLGAKLLELVFHRQQRREERDTSKIRRLEERHEKCEDKLAAVVQRLAALEHHHASLIPRWIKDARKRIVWVNSRALISIFAPLDYSRDQVEGHTFQDLLDADAARMIDGMDSDALAHPGNPVSTLMQLHPRLPKMHVVKIAGVGRDGELIYEGFAFPLNDPTVEAARNDRRQEEQRGQSALLLRGPDPDQD